MASYPLCKKCWSLRRNIGGKHTKIKKKKSKVSECKVLLFILKLSYQVRFCLKQPTMFYNGYMHLNKCSECQ